MTSPPPPHVNMNHAVVILLGPTVLSPVPLRGHPGPFCPHNKREQYQTSTHFLVFLRNEMFTNAAPPHPDRENSTTLEAGGGDFLRSGSLDEKDDKSVCVCGGGGGYWLVLSGHTGLEAARGRQHSLSETAPLWSPDPGDNGFNPEVM